MNWSTCRGLIVAGLLVLPLQVFGGPLLSPVPVSAQTIGPPDCGPDLDGVTWTDPRTGEKWQCKKVGKDLWEWRPAEAERLAQPPEERFEIHMLNGRDHPAWLGRSARDPLR